VAFTAEQIPGIEGRMYPKELAGEGYENGIPIHAEADLPKLIKELKVDECILAYSDLHHEEVMKKASLVLANGADFKLMGTNATMIKSTKPVIAVCAVRTGVGKSQTTRAVVEELKKHGKKAVVIRHPMPYGDLVKQAVQRYEKLEDLDKHECTIEEREEYENHIEMGNILYAGVDYEKIIREAEKEADVILWDGGNNDYSFYKTDLHFTLVDPHRPGHELTYYPGAANVMMANVLLVAKCNTAEKENIDKVMTNIKEANPNAQIVKCDSIITCEKANELKGKKVLVVEDGPTLTHGEMRYGAGTIAAKDAGAEVVDPKEYAVGSILDTFKKHPHLDKLLPAMGYGAKQIKELEETINKVPCDYVLSGTPIDLSKVLKVNKPIVRVKYEYKDNGEMAKIIEDFVKTHCK
jgi:predicted GTPase